MLLRKDYRFFQNSNIITYRSEKQDSSNSKLKAEVEEAEEVAPAADKAASNSASPPFPLPNPLLTNILADNKKVPILPSYTSNTKPD